MALVTIEVTQHHIDIGMRKKCDQCPIALAISPLLRSDCVPNVSSRFHIRDFWDREVFACYWPDEAAQFISNFDTENPVEPFKFQLEIPQQFLRN